MTKKKKDQNQIGLLEMTNTVIKIKNLMDSLTQGWLDFLFSDLLLTNRVWKREKNNFRVENPDRHLIPTFFKWSRLTSPVIRHIDYYILLDEMQREGHITPLR